MLVYELKNKYAKNICKNQKKKKSKYFENDYLFSLGYEENNNLFCRKLISYLPGERTEEIQKRSANKRTFLISEQKEVNTIGANIQMVQASRRRLRHSSEVENGDRGSRSPSSRSSFVRLRDKRKEKKNEKSISHDILSALQTRPTGTRTANR
jgi:hypothetical protein